MFIIDFDDTLFDTHGFKKLRFNKIRSIGISRDDYEKSYLLARSYENGVMSYTNGQHAKILGQMGYSESLVLSLLNESIDEIRRFLFPDCIDFLKFLRQYKKPLVLLSLGQTDFQKLKVSSCAIETYFDKIIYVNESKRQVLKNIIQNDGQDVWLINDKPKEYSGLLNIYPNLNLILKKSSSIPEDEYTQSKLPYFKTLTEIQRYVSAQFK